MLSNSRSPARGVRNLAGHLGRAARTRSLSKDMNPAFIVLIVFAAALVLIKTRSR